jgi:hypothetical protein
VPLRRPSVSSSEFSRGDGSDIRVNETWVADPPSFHQRCTAAVVADLCIERANDRRVVHSLSHLRQQLADVNVGRVCLDLRVRAAGWSSRFWIPRFELAGASGQPEQNYALLLPFDFASQKRVLQPVESCHVGGEGSGCCSAGCSEKSSSRQTMIGRSAKNASRFCHD